MESVDVSRVTDGDLIDRLRRLVRADHTLSARLLVHLGEVDARGLYREYAYASMFAYCVDELHMSEAQAYLRIQAARLSRQFPLIVELIGKGALHLTAIKLLGPHLTPDNHVQVLERASGKGKREIELLVAELAPKPDVPSRLRKLPEARRVLVTQTVDPAAPTRLAAFASEASVPTRSGDASPAPLAAEMPSAPAVSASQAAFALETPRARASSTPLSPGRYKLELTAGQALHDKLQQLKNLLRHQVPDGDLAIIVECAVDLLLDKTVKQRFAQTPAPRKPRAIKRSRNVNSRYIPRAVIREVYQRDAGQCTFVSPDGKRCCERGFLEFHHHDIPYGRGGKATTDNLRLACRAFNALFAERDFGTEYMRSKLLHARGRACAVHEPFLESGAAGLGPERVQVCSSRVVSARDEGMLPAAATTRIRPACGP